MTRVFVFSRIVLAMSSYCRHMCSALHQFGQSSPPSVDIPRLLFEIGQTAFMVALSVSGATLAAANVARRLHRGRTSCQSGMSCPVPPIGWMVSDGLK
jgi:hypothetical protein